MAAARKFLAAFRLGFGLWVGTPAFWLWLASMVIWGLAFWYDALDWWNFVPLAASMAWGLAEPRGYKKGAERVAKDWTRAELGQFVRWAEQVLAHERADDLEDVDKLQEAYRTAKRQLAELGSDE